MVGLRLAIGSALVLVAVSACGGSDEWSAATRRRFLDECAPFGTTAACECALKRFQSNDGGDLSEDQFLQVLDDDPDFIRGLTQAFVRQCDE